jgi:hypothetical protein
VEIASIDGPGALQQLWFTLTGAPNTMHLEITWDGQAEAAVQTPLGAFFCCGWDEFWPVASAPVCLNPRMGFAAYWPMPFREHARVTVHNASARDEALFYQINYALTPVPPDAAQFHAQYRRHRPESGGRVVILDDVEGPGHYVGTALAWGAVSRGWWGEGEVRFALDGDGTPERPGCTVVGTGLEDYVGGAWGFAVDGDYRGFSTPHTGFWPHDDPAADSANAVGRPASTQRFDLYRWHIADPLRFARAITVTVDALGWNDDWTYRLRDDEVRSVALWYQRPST